MDIDLEFISSMMKLGDSGFSKVKKKGFTKDFLKGQSKEAFELIEHHVIEYGKMPSLDYFTSKTGISVLDVPEPLELYLDELRKRAIWNKTREGYEKLNEHIESRNGDKALEIFSETIKEARECGLSGAPTESLLGLGDEVIDYYNKLRAGERGILTPWENINDVTLGFWPGDLVVFVARMGVGKSFALLMMARRAWMDGKKVLFVGTEMARLKMAIRFYAIHLKLPYRELTRGKLGHPQEVALQEGIQKFINSDGLHIVGDDFDAKMSDIEAATEEYKPDILFVDGLYLVKNRGKDRHTMVSNTADDLKRLAKRQQIPLVASSQFNREAGPNDKKAVSATNVGITDVIGWNADVMYALYQTEDMASDKLMGFKPLKLRESSGRDFMSNWNFNDMNFEQISGEDDFVDNDYNKILSKDKDNDNYNGGDYLF